MLRALRTLNFKLVGVSLHDRPRIAVGDSRIALADPGIAVGDPRIALGDPRVGVGDPRVGEGDRRVGVEDPRMVTGNPREGTFAMGELRGHRMKEHRAAARVGQLEKSAVAEHAWQDGR